MNYKVLEIRDSEEWKEVLSKLPPNQQDIYFTPEYYSLYQNNGDGKACCFMFEKDNNCVLYPFLINSIDALGYQLGESQFYDIQGAYGYNGILTSSDDLNFIKEYHVCFDEWCKDNNIVSEFTRFHPLLANQRWASPKMQTIFNRHTVRIDLLPSIEDVWMQSISGNNRNHIRKAERAGVSIIESEDYEEFRRVYNQTMRNLNAEDFYFFPSTYYSEIKDTLDGNTSLCFALYDGKPIAVCIFFYYGDYAHYHLGGRDAAFYKIAAHPKLLWYGIEKAKKLGCKVFHLGGGTSGDEEDSLLKYKKLFSKETGEFWIGKRVHNQEVYDDIVSQWRDKYPECYSKNKNLVLGYRDIKK